MQLQQDARNAGGLCYIAPILNASPIPPVSACSLLASFDGGDVCIECTDAFRLLASKGKA